MNYRTVLVIGGAGFIGSHVNQYLHACGYDTIVLDNLINGHKWAAKWGEFIEADFQDNVILDRVFSEFDIQAVMHFASFIQVGESV